jgi:hypothetical protein
MFSHQKLQRVKVDLNFMLFQVICDGPEVTSFCDEIQIIPDHFTVPVSLSTEFCLTFLSRGTLVHSIKTRKLYYGKNLSLILKSRPVVIF